MPSIMEVGSPIKVAAPCKLEEMAMVIRRGTGEVFSFLAIAKAIGVSMSKVETFSSKALIPPAKRARKTTESPDES
mgnify:CR=1 FL=1